jgi:hypothetical protein
MCTYEVDFFKVVGDAAVADGSLKSTVTKSVTLADGSLALQHLILHRVLINKYDSYRAFHGFGQAKFVVWF